MQYNKVVTFGCSLTRDNYFKTWANYLADYLECPLDNHAERGAGYTYLLQKLQSIQLSTDNFYAIMWPACDRWDLWVNDATPQLQAELPLASWLDGKNPSFIHYKNYSKTEGWYVTGTYPRGMKHEYYKRFYTEVAHVNHAWSTIIAVQNMLERAEVDYVMCNAWPIKEPVQSYFDQNKNFNYKLYHKINFKKFVHGASREGLMAYTKRLALPWHDNAHPSTHAQRTYFEKRILRKVKSLTNN